MWTRARVCICSMHYTFETIVLCTICKRKLWFRIAFLYLSLSLSLFIRLFRVIFCKVHDWLKKRAFARFSSNFCEYEYCIRSKEYSTTDTAADSKHKCLMDWHKNTRKLHNMAAEPITNVTIDTTFFGSKFICRKIGGIDQLPVYGVTVHG